MKTYTFESRVAHIWASFETIVHTVTAPSQELAYSMAKMQAEQTACPEGENVTNPGTENPSKHEKAGKCKETPEMF